MDNNAIDSRHPEPPRRSGWPDTLGTWRLCRKRICQRRKCCCGDTIACLRTSLPLLPDSVREWFLTLMECQFAGLPFEDAMAQLDGSWEEQGFVAWRKAIGQPVAGPNTRGSSQLPGKAQQ